MEEEEESHNVEVGCEFWDLYIHHSVLPFV
jgi:hypothetical protein